MKTNKLPSGRQKGATFAEYVAAALGVVTVFMLTDRLIVLFSEHLGDYFWAVSLPF